jgi:Zn-dependent protease
MQAKEYTLNETMQTGTQKDCNGESVGQIDEAEFFALWAFFSKWSILIGRLFGIEMRVSIFILLGLVFWFGHVLFGYSFYPLLFLFIGISFSILLHELSHSLVAKYFQRKVLGIVLFPPFGGIAFLEIDTKRYHQNVLICLSGPAISFVIGILLYSISHDIKISHILYLSNTLEISPFSTAKFFHFLKAIAEINLLTALFNMIPLFPLDGGRILRDILLSLRIIELRTNFITLCISTVCFLGISVWALTERYYINVLIALVLIIVSFLSLSGWANKYGEENNHAEKNNYREDKS